LVTALGISNLFKQASTKLAGLYLAVLMVICLIFSIPIYELSLQELDRGLRHPGVQFEVSARGGMPARFIDDLIEEQNQSYFDAKSRIIRRLVVVNAIILVAGGFASYYLARRTLEPIEEVHNAQARFTADASHELRTPITVMQTENEVTLMDPRLTLKTAKGQLGSNIDELKKLTGLTEDLLRLASVEDIELKKEKVSIEGLINQSVERVLPLAEKKKITIKKSPIAKGHMHADKRGLPDALVIVLDNAIKYSPVKSKITLSCTRERNCVIFKVADEGVGIDKSDLPHIFDRFYRADSSRTKDQTSGHGLGLAIAKNIVDAHGGAISAYSQPGKGAVFTIKLPS
jgi:two-component system, OmpR family, sensor histidine kinase CiaH